jgi:hypothetical protein
VNQTKNPAPLAGGKPGQDVNQRPSNGSTLSKWQRVLEAFLTGKSFNRFEAARELHDHCLHSTVSTIQGKGVRIYRREETIPGYQGSPTRCCRYWLPSSGFQKAREVMKGGVAACNADGAAAAGVEALSGIAPDRS